jgi:hypothetical protein
VAKVFSVSENSKPSDASFRYISNNSACIEVDKLGCLKLITLIALAVPFTTCKQRFVAASSAAKSETSASKLSLFEEYLANNNSSSFLDLVNQLKTDGYTLEYTLLPKGRSLVRDKVSFSQPRVVFAIKESKNEWPKLDLTNKVFFAYAEGPKQIEAISWNPYQSKMDFFVAHDVQPESGGNIVLIKEKDETCTVCHQGGIPIFSSTPWVDTTIFPYTREKVRIATGDNYLGIALPTVNEPISAAFQESVISATDLVELRAVVPRACDGEVECNRGIVENAIHRVFHPDDLKTIKGTAAIEKGLKVSKTMPLFLNGIPGPIISANDPAIEREVKPANIEKVIEFVLNVDLRKKRQNANGTLDLGCCALQDIARNAVEGIGLERYDINVLKSYQEKTLADALKSERFTKSLSQLTVLNKVGVMRGLLSALGKADNDLPKEYGLANAQPGFAEPLPDLKNMNSQQLVEHFCGECHAKANSLVVQLDLANPKTLLEAGAKEYVTEDTMPPYSDEGKRQRGYTVDVKKKILDYLAQ